MIPFTAGVLVGMALAAFAALALAYYLDRREQMASMRRHSQMTAALSGMGTPRAKGGIVAGPMRATVGDNGPEAIVPLDRLPYLPESRDADFQP